MLTNWNLSKHERGKSKEERMESLRRKRNRRYRTSKTNFILKKSKAIEKLTTSTKRRSRSRLQRIERIRLLLEKPRSNAWKKAKGRSRMLSDQQAMLVLEGMRQFKNE